MTRVTFALLACLVIVTEPAKAQDGWGLSPSLTMMQVHDSNLFAAPIDPQADFITRVTPSIETSHRSTTWTVNGRYGFDVERFDRHPELSSASARHDALAGIEYRPTRRLTLAVGGQHSRTQTPGELNLLTGLAFARAGATRIGAHGSITRHFSRITTATIDYRFTNDRLADSMASRAHAASVGADHMISTRDTVRLTSRVDQFSFVTRPGSPSEEVRTSTATSLALTVGWTRAITRETEVAIAAGPRGTNGAISPEVSASVRMHSDVRSLSFSYGRTRTTIIGLADAADTHIATATAGWSLRRWLQVTVSPSFVHTEIASLRANVYRLTMDVVHPIGNGLSIALAGAAHVQNGNLYSRRANETIQQRTVMLKIIAEPSARGHRS